MISMRTSATISPSTTYTSTSKSIYNLDKYKSVFGHPRPTNTMPHGTNSIFVQYNICELDTA
jgi:hypothetical protein